MKKNILYIVLIITLCACCATHASAQRLPKKLPKVSAVKVPTATSATTSNINRTSQQVNRAAQQALSTTRVTRPQPTTPLGKFTTKYRRPLIGFQKLFGLSTREAWENLQSLGAVHIPPAPRPKLNTESAFYTQNLADLAPSRIARESAAAPHPFQSQRGLIYRGLALNKEEAFRNILENGLLIKDAGSESNNLMLAMSGGRAPSSAARRKITNLTDQSTDAVMWAGKRMGQKAINTVVVVKSNATGNIIMVYEDIPAEDIYAVTALLRVNGKPTWCKVELEGDGFRITPYQEDIPTVEVGTVEPEANASRTTPLQEDLPSAE